MAGPSRGSRGGGPHSALRDRSQCSREHQDKQQGSWGDTRNTNQDQQRIPPPVRNSEGEGLSCVSPLKKKTEDGSASTRNVACTQQKRERTGVPTKKKKEKKKLAPGRAAGTQKREQKPIQANSTTSQKKKNKSANTKTRAGPVPTREHPTSTRANSPRPGPTKRGQAAPRERGPGPRGGPAQKRQRRQSIKAH